MEKREDSFQSYTSKELEAVGGNVTFTASPSLDRPGCLVKLIVTALALHKVKCFSQFLWLFPDKTELICFPPVCFALPEECGEGSRKVSEHTRERRLIDQITLINQLL